MSRFALYGILAGFALALCINLVGCGSAAPIHHTSTPVTLSSNDSAASEMAAACDTYRARRVHTPVRLSDGTPVWCF